VAATVTPHAANATVRAELRDLKRFTQKPPARPTCSTMHSSRWRLTAVAEVSRSPIRVCPEPSTGT
jgi:hypothetical protein